MPEMFVLPFRPAYDSNGRTVPGAQAWFTLSGTNTETPVYSDSALTVEHANPLVADGLGKFPRAYLDPAVDYRCRVYEEDAEVGVDSPIPDHDYDPYTGAEQGSQGNPGTPGDDGVNATVLTVGSVVTGAAGTDADVDATSIGGGVYELDFTIPRGAPGVGGVSDGDYGDVVVSAGGTVMAIDNNVVSLAKMADIAENVVIGRQTAGAGDPEALAIGAAAGTDILDRDAGDGRYIQRTEDRTFAIYIPASGMVSRTTNGAADGTTETTTNKVMLATKDFDPSTTEYVQFQVRMPESWNEGTVTAQFSWIAGGTGTAIWRIQGLARSDDDVLDTAFGTFESVTDTVTATTDLMQSNFTGALTLSGTPAAGDMALFQVYRNGGTLASDAKLVGVTLKFTVNDVDDG